MFIITYNDTKGLSTIVNILFILTHNKTYAFEPYVIEVIVPTTQKWPCTTVYQLSIFKVIKMQNFLNNI